MTAQELKALKEYIDARVEERLCDDLSAAVRRHEAEQALDHVMLVVPTLPTTD